MPEVINFSCSVLKYGQVESLNGVVTRSAVLVLSWSSVQSSVSSGRI
jgi:hypothetical protein